MKRVVRIDTLRVSGLERAGTMALPGRLEAAVRRALDPAVDRAVDSLPREAADVTSVRVRVDAGPLFGPDELGAAVAAAIGKAGRERGVER